MSETTYRRIFYFGAFWNLAGGTLILLATNWIFSSAGLTPPSPGAYYYSWIGLFMTFGIGYYLVGRDPVRNRDIALLGAIGKLCFSAVFVYGYLTQPGRIPGFFWIPLIGDVVFAILFLMFYSSVPRWNSRTTS
jgi:hypothetical protein